MAVRGDKHVHYLVRALVTVFFVPSSLAEGQVRLTNGSSRCSGRVEVYYNSRWGTVCDDSWSVFDGEVVCRQLDCGTVLSAPKNAAFGKGTGEIWLDDVHCSGNESSLTQCQHNGFGKHDCDHDEDAGVVCSVALVLLVVPLVGGGLLLTALLFLLLFLLPKKPSRSNQTEINLQSHNKANEYIEDSEDSEGYYASIDENAVRAGGEEFANKVNESSIEEEVYDDVKMDDEEQKEEDDIYMTPIEVDAEDQDNFYANT